MATSAVVIGGGPGALRAAAVLARRGRAVTLLLEGDLPDLGGIPEDRGVWVREPVGDALGAVVEVPWRRGVLRGGKQAVLPTNPGVIAGLIPRSTLPGAIAAWARTRGKVELARLIGGGHEQRTYEHWLAGRYGAPLYEALFAPYAKRRFGSLDGLSCNVARLVHGVPQPDTAWAPAQGHRAMAAALLDGVEVKTRVAFIAGGLSRGKVETGSGTFEGEIFVDLPPARVIALLGLPDQDALARDAALLGASHSLQVRVRVADDQVATCDELHVLDADAPFFWVSRPGGLPGETPGTLIAHFTCVEGDPTWTRSDADLLRLTAEALGKAGLSGATAEGEVRRYPHALPAWQSVHLSRYRRYLLEMDSRGVVPVGRLGAHSVADPSEESVYLYAVTSEERPSLRECHRAHLEPPVLDSEERVALRRLIER